MQYKLPELGYAYDAVEPYIDARTMEIHHTKHHATYVNNLNNAVKDVKIELPECPTELLGMLDKIPEAVRTAVRNNGGGVANHNLYWKILTPGGAKEPQGALAKAIESDLGGYAAFTEAFTKAALGRFGSGWAWLYVKKDGKLAIGSTPNQDSPVMGAKYAGIEGRPLLLVDVWEHAYYLKFQNRRADYLAAFLKAVNWTKVGESFEKAHGCSCHC